MNRQEKEAPERIYVCNNVFPTHVDWEGSPINTKRIDNHDIEYVRTDVFIEKACKLLVDCIEDFMARRMEIWDEESKKQTLENLRKTLKKY